MSWISAIWLHLMKFIVNLHPMDVIVLVCLQLECWLISDAQTQTQCFYLNCASLKYMYQPAYLTIKHSIYKPCLHVWHSFQPPWSLAISVSLLWTQFIVIVTLCTYAQQGYVFDCVYVCILCICGQKTGCLRSCRLKIFRCTTCSLSLTIKKQKEVYYVRWFIQRKKFRSILLMEQEH